jgi:transposase-like protein
MARARRVDTPEFEAGAVKRVSEKGSSVAAAARSLGTHETLLRPWEQAPEAQRDRAFPGHGRLPPFPRRSTNGRKKLNPVSTLRGELQWTVCAPSPACSTFCLIDRSRRVLWSNDSRCCWVSLSG